MVRTDKGAVRGTRTAGHHLFRGIPYAGPPTGEHRWAAPRPARPWPGVKDATRPGPLCPQVGNGFGDVSSLEEDCLVLNVTAPARTAPGGRAPVLVWIHGDGTIGGGDFFDARRLADRGLVVVTINYRLGVFGGFAHPGLKGSGTFGLQDQQATDRFDFGAYHASDQPYLFEEKEVRERFTPAQARLSDAMTDQWAAFAAHGTPDRPGLPAWPRFDPRSPVPYTQSLALDAVGAVDYAKEHRLDFWRRLP